MPALFGSQEPDQEALAARPLSKAEGRSRPKFLMMLHPDRWVWDQATKSYLPELVKLKLISGLQGVGENGEDGAARAYFNEKGFVVVNNGDARLKSLIAGGKYRTRWVAQGSEANKGVWAYGWPWEGYEWVGGRLEWRTDESTRRKFLQGLVKLQIVPEMSPSLRNQLLREEIARLHTMQDRMAKKVGRMGTTDIKAQETLIEELKKDLEKHQGVEEVSAPEHLKVSDLSLPDDDEDDDAPKAKGKKGGV